MSDCDATQRLTLPSRGTEATAEAGSAAGSTFDFNTVCCNPAPLFTDIFKQTPLTFEALETDTF